MRFSLATNFDDRLPTLVKRYDVFELYGKLSADRVGGGRASFMLPPISRRVLKRHVAACHREKIGFNYLLNAVCLDNLEYTRQGQKRLRRLLDWLCDIGVTSVTLANPFLLRLIKRSYPHLAVRVSVFAAVNDIRRAQYWEDLGADCIALDSLQINREFEVLRKIREAVSCRLELLASNSCVQNCPLQPYHPNLLSHASQRGHRSKGFVIDWCLFWCSYVKLRESVHYLRADWIRPEDLHHYEALGYDQIKLTERGFPTDLLVLRACAYHERRYEGNLLDLVQPYHVPPTNGATQRRGFAWIARHFLRPGTVRWRRLPLFFRLAKRRGLLGEQEGPPPVYVDNRALDGFINRFLTHGCRDRDCRSCRYCHGWAERTVQLDEAWRRECLALYDRAFTEMETGRLWGVN
ncbi:MAG: U32 family peptidase [Rhodothermales bacterium]